MKNYAKRREFEKAGEIKKQIFALKHINDVALIKNETGRENVLEGTLGRSGDDGQRKFPAGNFRVPQGDFRKPSTREKLRVLLEHTKLFEQMFAGVKSFAVMKKHFRAYVAGFDGAAELRAKLMETSNTKEVSDAISKYLALSGARKLTKGAAVL
jgi:tRNA-dihydrouridine synthase